MDFILILVIGIIWIFVFYYVWNYVEAKPFLEEIKARRRLKELSGLSGSPKEAERKKYKPTTIVFSDIDDTIKPSGGKIYGRFAGVDKSYVKVDHYPLYPGMARFLYELSKLSNPELPAPEWIPRVNFISGRPWGRFSSLQLKLLTTVNGWGTNAEPHIVLNGRKRDTARHLPTLPKNNVFKDYGETKFRNLSNLFKSKKDCKFFAIGDNGQGDVFMASKIYQDENLGPRARGIFIHEVLPRKLDQWRKHIADPRVIFYNNVIDLVDKINESIVVEVKFPPQAREVIHRAFMEEFQVFQNHPGTLKDSSQVRLDSRAFEQLRQPVETNRFSSLSDTAEQCRQRPRQSFGEAEKPGPKERDV